MGASPDPITKRAREPLRTPHQARCPTPAKLERAPSTTTTPTASEHARADLLADLDDEEAEETPNDNPSPGR
jgi:hypothetical protein